MAIFYLNIIFFRFIWRELYVVSHLFFFIIDCIEIFVIEYIEICVNHSPNPKKNSLLLCALITAFFSQLQYLSQDDDTSMMMSFFHHLSNWLLSIRNAPKHVLCTHFQQPFQPFKCNIQLGYNRVIWAYFCVNEAQFKNLHIQKCVTRTLTHRKCHFDKFQIIRRQKWSKQTYSCNTCHNFVAILYLVIALLSVMFLCFYFSLSLSLGCPCVWRLFFLTILCVAFNYDYNVYGQTVK